MLILGGGSAPKSGLKIFSILKGKVRGLWALGGGDKGNRTSGCIRTNGGGLLPSHDAGGDGGSAGLLIGELEPVDDTGDGIIGLGDPEGGDGIEGVCGCLSIMEVIRLTSNT